MTKAKAEAKAVAGTEQTPLRVNHYKPPALPEVADLVSFFPLLSLS